MCYHEEAIIGYCSYCKNPIRENETYVISGEDKYHVECNNQMNLYMDSFGDVVHENEESE